MIEYLKILRPFQWYKNLVIFIPVLFGLQLFNFDSYPKFLFGFLWLSLISGSLYIFNDFIDYPKDLLNPRKRNKPLVTGKISLWDGYRYFWLLLVITVFLTLADFRLFPVVFALVINTISYSIFFKNYPVIDILSIGTNYSLRTLFGGILFNININPLLYIAMFFAGLLFVQGKRLSELYLLKRKASKIRSTLKFYKIEMLNISMILTVFGVIGVYLLFIFSENKSLLTSFPLLFIALFFYLESFSNKPTNPDKLFLNKKFLSILLMFVLVTIGVLYV